MNPLRDGRVQRRLLMVLGLGEAHAVFLRIAILVGEDDHEVAFL